MAFNHCRDNINDFDDLCGLSAKDHINDAGIPGLLSLPYLGFISSDDHLYKSTRRFILSDNNPYFFRGSPVMVQDGTVVRERTSQSFEGLGSPHVGLGWIWPMGIAVQAITSTSRQECGKCVDMLIASTAGTGFIHEAFWKDDPARYTRSWFAWANSLFAEVVLKLVPGSMDVNVDPKVRESQDNKNLLVPGEPPVEEDERDNLYSTGARSKNVAGEEFGEDWTIELEASKQRVKIMEEEAAMLREMQKAVEKEMNFSPHGEGIRRRKSIHCRFMSETRKVSACGTINRVTILCDKWTGHPKGYAYVEFADPLLVGNALVLNDSFFKGRLIKVNAKRANVPGLAARGRGRGRGGLYRGAPRYYRGFYAGYAGRGRPYR
ncbi:hypothetical protein HK102_005232 [Quaeritorhiza haematococci]|nr:hypothetical protein HK102_005232 [Quaeritorhiza haematococci]